MSTLMTETPQCDLRQGRRRDTKRSDHGSILVSSTISGYSPRVGLVGCPFHFADKETRVREAANVPRPTVCRVNPGQP